MKTGLEKNKAIETPYLKISGNCLEILDTTFQLSNISLFSTTDVEGSKFPIVSIPTILIGLAILRYNTVIGLIAVIVGVVFIHYWYTDRQEAKLKKRLTIVTNSGNAFPIVFDDQQFLAATVELMTEIIRNPSVDGDVIINVHDCKFSGSSSMIREMNNIG